MPVNKVEIEAKFVIPDETTFLALRELRRLGDFELKPEGTQTLTDRYLDTGDKRLFRAGIACRIRRTGKKQSLTLKSLTPAEGNIHRRQEMRVEVDPKLRGDQPWNWSESKARDVVLRLVDQTPLETLFIINQTRHVFQALLKGQPVIEFSVDRVSFRDIEAPDYLELEAELIESGTEADLNLFVETLQAQYDLPPESQSKFERAWFRFGLSKTESEGDLSNVLSAASGPPTASPPSSAVGPDVASSPEISLNVPVSQIESEENSVPVEYPLREAIGLKATDTLAEAGRKVFGFHFARMLHHEPGTRLGEDIEALHDMRVATRRLRAAFPIFGKAFSKKSVNPLRTGLRNTGRALGRVRDLDVFMQKLQRYQKSLPKEEQAGLQTLLNTWSTEREQARQEMLSYLDSSKYARFKHNMLEFVTTEGLGAKPIRTGSPVPYQLRHIVPGLIYARFEAVQAYEVMLDNASLDTLHQLRIAFKEFRYILEYFREILGEECEMVITEVKFLQDHLGDLNDADVASGILHDFILNWEQSQFDLSLSERQNPAQLAAYLNTRLNDRHRLTVTFPEAWERFNRPEVRRNLALAIAAL